ncbi:MAG: M20/M25/M40 family metallo-hydrolase [Pirellulaceae bacterium]
MSRMIVALSALFLIYFDYSPAIGQELPPQLADGLNEINEQRVGSTLQFLCSDAMGGRGTGSQEFRIAAAYVRSRLDAAGAEGGGFEGSFFHTKQLTLSQTPSQSIDIELESETISTFGLLNGGEDDVHIQGNVGQLDDEWKLPDDAHAKVAVVKLEAGSEREQRSVFFRISNACVRLKQSGVEALIICLPADHQMVTLAKQLRAKPRPYVPQRAIALPVVLVDRKHAESLSKSTVQFDVPAQVKSEYEAQNVIGFMRGSDPELSKECILFSAHLDHLGSTDDLTAEDRVYNGADDDASGVTAVLTLADAFSKLPVRPKRSIVFMTFWGEESGLLGSKDFAANPSWPLEKIVANINIEMIGRPEPGATNKLWMTGWNESDLGKLLNEGAQAVGVDIFEHPQFSAMLYRQSDNWSFVEKGVIAHSVSGGSLHEDYHQLSDEFEKMNIPHMTEVIKGLFVGSLPLANAEVTPQKSK